MRIYIPRNLLLLHIIYIKIKKSRTLQKYLTILMSIFNMSNASQQDTKISVLLNLQSLLEVSIQGKKYADN